MAQDSNDRVTIREYLLGQLADLQRQDLEHRLVSDDPAFEELLVAEDELIDAYLKGELDAEQKGLFESVFLGTSERQEKLRFGRAFMNYVSTQTAEKAVAQVVRPAPGWRSQLFASPTRIAVYALLIVGVAVATWQVFFRQSDVDKGLIALNDAYRQQRPIEARISKLDYAPFSTTRGGESSRIDVLARDRAERYLLDALAENPGPAAHHALGKHYLAKKEFDKAIEHFEEGIRADPDNAQIYADLGAAFFEKEKIERGGGEPGKAFGTLGRCLESLNKALELDQNLLEPLFNKALCLERMSLKEQAKEAWRQYVQRDPSSKWTEEAQRHLDLLGQTVTPKTSTQVLQDFLNAHQHQDEERAWQILSQTREMITETMVPLQLARSFSVGQQQSEQANLLTALSYAGKLEARRAGDPFFSEMAREYAVLTERQLGYVEEGHRKRSTAYELCLRSRFSEALAEFRQSRGRFESAESTLDVWLTDYWIGYCQARLGNISESTALLETLSESCSRHNHKWLLAQSLALIGSNDILQREYSKAQAVSHQALTLSADAADTYMQQKLLGQLTELYRQLGDSDRALDSIARALSLETLYFSSPRQTWRNHAAAGEILHELKLFHAAVAFGVEELRLATEALDDPAIKHDSYLDLGKLNGATHNYQEALRLAQKSREIAQSLGSDPGSRFMAAYSSLQLGHFSRQAGDCNAALNDYGEALGFFGSPQDAGSSLNYYDTRKGRLLCFVALKNELAVLQELRIVLDLFEQHRAMILEEQSRNSFFDKEQNIYDVAIAHAQSTHNPQEAFDYSEASRARSLLDMLHNQATATPSQTGSEITFSTVTQPLKLNQIRARIPSQIQIVQYSVLPDRILIWLVSQTQFEVFEQSMPIEALNSLAHEFVGLLATKSDAHNGETSQRARRLYDLLVGPIESSLDPQKIVCIVPDKVLNQLPFAALIAPDSYEYLVARHTLLYAPSASVFILRTEAAEKRRLRGEEKLLSFGDPAFDHLSHPELSDLPEAAREAKTVSDFYPNATCLLGANATKDAFLREMQEADIIHFAGHYLADERVPTRSRLLLAKVGGSSENGELSAYEILLRKQTRPNLIVLSACHTRLDRYYNGEGAIGISRMFLGAGVTVVVASQWMVDSAATAELMIAFHRYRSQHGMTTPAALRQAQLDLLQRNDYSQPYFWAAFAPIGGSEKFQETTKERSHETRSKRNHRNALHRRNRAFLSY